MTTLNPYISFPDGQARAAMEFYQSVFGGELTLSTFGEAGMPDVEADGIMHAQLQSGTLTLMGADTIPGMPVTVGDNVQISLSGPASDEAELRGYWDALSTGGQLGVPLEKAPWGDYFGMCTDRFGIKWMVNIAGE